MGTAFRSEDGVSGVVRFGIVGTGRMASTMMEAFRQAQGVEVCAVASGDSERSRVFAARHGIPVAAPTIEDLVSRADLDAVYVANANVLHAPTTLSALRAGKPVLCEKPFAVSSDEGERVISAARQSRQVFLESMWTPHLPAYRRLFELVRTGAIGEALHLQASFGYPTERSVESALFAPGPGSGVLLDRGVYPISLAIHLFGAPVDVQATIRRDPSAVDVSASLQLRHSGGPHSQLMCSFECLCANDAVVSGAGGEARLLPPLVGSQMVSHRRSKTISVSRDAPHESRGKQRFKRAILGLPFVERLRPLVVGRSEVLKYGASPYLPMVRHFIQMVQQRDEGVLAREQQISLDVLKVIERARER